MADPSWGATLGFRAGGCMPRIAVSLFFVAVVRWVYEHHRGYRAR